MLLGFALPHGMQALDPDKSVFQFNLQSWTRQHGLPAGMVTAIEQTADGYIWLGTANGLLRFDGLEFKPVAVDFPGARGQQIRKLVRAKAGGLWLAINHGGFAGFDGRAFSPIADSRWDNASTTGKTIMQAWDGSVWTGSNLGSGRWIEGRPEESFLDNTAERVFAICEDPRGRIWFGTEERGLYYREGEQVHRVRDPSLQEEIIFALAADAEGRIWVGTQRELRAYSAEGERLEIPELKAGVNALLIDRHGVLWVATAEMGLARYRDGVFTFLRHEDGLGTDNVMALCEDEEGSLWIGTREGLNQLTDLRFPMLSHKEGIARGPAHTVSASRDGGLWITTAGGLSYYDGAATRPRGPAALRNSYIKLGHEARNGDFYFVDGTKTISVVSNGAIVRTLSNERWPEAMAEDATGMLVAVGVTLCRIGPGGVEPYAFDGPAPRFGYIDNLTVARDGAIWVSSYHGVFRVWDGKFQQWDSVGGLSGERVHAVMEDVDGSIWAALETGLARIKDGEIRNIRVENGLPDNRLYAIVADNLGFLWFDSGGGIFRASRKDLNDFVEGRAPSVGCELFQGQDSAKFAERIDQEYSGCKTRDGRIWFPTSRGVLVIDPAKLGGSRVAPPVRIETVRVEDAVLPKLRNAKLAVGDRRVEFFFSALSYISPQQVRVRYQLEGFDTGWIEAGTRRSALYRVEPGRYTFRVEAANAAGVWNTTAAEFGFEVPRAFYETIWFASLSGVAGLMILSGSYRWQYRRWKNRQQTLQNENNLLEEKVQHRTAELGSSLSLLQTTLDSTPDGILAIAFAGGRPVFNQRFCAMWRIAPAALAGANDADIQAMTAAKVKDPAAFLARVQEVHATPGSEAFDVIELGDGQVFERTCKPQRAGDRITGIVIAFHDITERRRAESELESMNQRLRDTSRQAGMAEVATSVLHNVGNVLNSVNVSTTLMVEHVRASKVDRVTKLHELLSAQAGDLDGFLQSARGRRLPKFIETLSRELTDERSEMMVELELLRKNVEHIKDIVAMQQSYAKVSGLAESIPVTELVEDALRMSAGSLVRHDVMLVRDFQARPVITVEKHKVLQILVNLLRNATHACDESGAKEKRTTVRITAVGGRVKIAVIDNGVGIAAENLTRIFAHGFTTKKEGHGFGLHNGALSARQMNGSLTVSSDGPGQGATFVLELPEQPDATAA